MVSGAKITAGYRGIYNESTGTVTATVNEEEITATVIINEATITATNNDAVVNSGAGNVIITGGTISGKIIGIYNNGSGTVTVEGGTISTSGKSSQHTYGCIHNGGTGEVNITNVTITAKDAGVYNASGGTIKVNKSTIEAVYYGINNNGKGDVTVEGAEITVASGGSTYYSGIYNSTGTVTINNSNIKSTASKGKGIYNSTGTITLGEGTTVEATGTNSYGIYNNSTGIINLGEKGGDVSIESPAITGTEWGLYNPKGKTYFYDGILTGLTGQSISSETITDQEEGYEVIKTQNTEDGTESATLQRLAIAKIVSTEKEYSTINEAAKEAGETETIQIIRNGIISGTAETIVVSQNKNIILDLNGHTLGVSKENMIENNGTLEITDSSKTGEAEGIGEISSSANNIIVNNEGATLKIASGTITNTVGGSGGYIQVINNKGQMEMTGGSITSTGSSTYGIYNIGTITMTGGSITSKGSNTYGIYNDEIEELKGTVLVNGERSNNRNI